MIRVLTIMSGMASVLNIGLECSKKTGTFDRIKFIEGLGGKIDPIIYKELFEAELNRLSSIILNDQQNYNKLMEIMSKYAPSDKSWLDFITNILPLVNNTVLSISIASISLLCLTIYVGANIDQTLIIVNRTLDSLGITPVIQLTRNLTISVINMVNRLLGYPIYNNNDLNNIIMRDRGNLYNINLDYNNNNLNIGGDNVNLANINMGNNNNLNNLNNAVDVINVAQADNRVGLIDGTLDGLLRFIDTSPWLNNMNRVEAREVVENEQLVIANNVEPVDDNVMEPFNAVMIDENQIVNVVEAMARNQEMVAGLQEIQRLVQAAGGWT